MAAAIYELQTSRQINDDIKSPGFTTRWVLTSETDDAAALAYVLANTDLILGGLWRQGVRLDPQGGGVWQVEVTYAVLEGTAAPAQSGASPPPPPDPPPAADDPLGPEWSFSTTGGNVHITQSKFTRAKVRAGTGFDAAPDYKQAIGVGKDGAVAGTDVIARKFELTTTRLLPSISFDYIRTLYALTGTTNNAEYLGFPRGELLFLGAEGQSKGENQGWSLTYHFLCMPTRDSIIISPELTIPSGMFGHDFVWCTYTEALDAASGFTVQKPLAAYVEQVYPEGDFDTLNI